MEESRLRIIPPCELHQRVKRSVEDIDSDIEHNPVLVSIVKFINSIIEECEPIFLRGICTREAIVYHVEQELSSREAYGITQWLYYHGYLSWYQSRNPKSRDSVFGSFIITWSPRIIADLNGMHVGTDGNLDNPCVGCRQKICDRCSRGMLYNRYNGVL